MEEIEKEIIAAIKESEPDVLYKYVEDYNSLMLNYKSVIREIKTKFEVLNDEFIIKNQRNPIEFVKSRIKKPSSIVEKLHRRGFEISSESIKKNLNDVAGVRVVCSFIDDIYTVADMLSNQDDVEVLQVKDYIKNPKENGYRSLHMIVASPVYFSNTKEKVKCEIQIRTIAMDFWASLEHTMKYKKEVENTADIIYELKLCADKITSVDYKMMDIRKVIENIEDKGNY